MKSQPRIFCIAVLLAAVYPVLGQDSSQPLPIDPQVSIGTLANGMSYYIRHNEEPANRAQFRLAVKAGSVLEDEDQQGLAHFLEHMAFENTENFPHGQIDEFLQSIGLEFGGDLNAYTSFDQTVYSLPVPTDNAQNVETVFQIMEDWAHGIAFDPEEIDQERSIVLEELRFRGDAFSRIFDQLLALLLAGSPYAERFPSGQKAVIDTFRQESLERFYRDWYHPELMALIAVGDFDPAAIESLLQHHFSGIPRAAGGRELPSFPVPDHAETIFSVISDPELPFPLVQVGYTRNTPAKGTVGAYRRDLAETLVLDMLQARLDEAANTAEAPFQFPGFVLDRVLTEELMVILAVAGQQGAEGALEGLLSEVERVVRFGFTRAELARQKVELLSQIEQVYRERDTTPSEMIAEQYVDHFIYGDPVLGIDYEWGQAQQVVPAMTLEEVNQAGEDLLTEHNRLIGAAFPQTEDFTLPGEDVLRAVLRRVGEADIQPYAEQDLTDVPLIAEIPASVEVNSRRTIPELGVAEWILANGVRVVLKPTDFRSDEILFTAFSPGGLSLAADVDYIAAWTAANVVAEAGVGAFSRIDLDRKLAGQAVEVHPWIGELQEGLWGSASPQDVETLFQLIHLYFTAPRQDELAFLTFQSQQRSLLENAGADPVTAFFDTVQVTLARNHPRRQPWTLAGVEQMDLEKSFAFYRDRFGDAGDFTFVFVGNLDLEQLQPLVETYLGGLPAAGRQESARDVGIRPPTGVIEKTVFKGQDERGLAWVYVTFTGPFAWNQQNRFEFNALLQLLDLRVMDVLRQELGEVYASQAEGNVSRIPVGSYELAISVPTSPESVGPLTSAIFGVIDDLQSAGPQASDVSKVREQLRQNREEDLRDNGFWLGALQWTYSNGEDPLGIVAYGQLLDGLTAAGLQLAAQRYLNKGNYVKVVLLPEGFAGNTAVLERYSDVVPQDFALEQNYPNPFNGGTVIRFALPQNGEVELTVYNLTGQKVVTLLEGQRPAGIYEVHWDGRDGRQRDLASGVYLYYLQVGQEVETRKLALVR